MKQAKVLIARDEGAYHIKVEGRANFDTSPPLRSFANSLDKEGLAGIYVDLSECVGMDSTFMGVLAMIGLKSKSFGVILTIVNADENCKKLLNGLGLQKILAYTEQTKPENQNWADVLSNADKTERAQTVLQAHDTLMKVDKDNIPRFKNVVEFVKKDLEKNDSQNNPNP